MKLIHKLFTVASAAFFIASAQAQNAGTVTTNAFAIGKGAGTTGYASLLCTSAQLAVGQSAAAPLCKTITGDWTLSATGAATLATVNSNVGSFGSVTNCPTFTVNAKGLITAASATTCTPAVGSVTGLGTGVATFLATPSSANLRAALTDEVGTGAAYFVGGALGTPASGTATNLTGLPLAGLVAQGAFTFVGNNTGSSAAPTAVDIAALTTKVSPAAGDYVILSDQAASGAWKKASVSTLASAGSVASIAGNTGAFTLSGGITNSTNDIRLSNMAAYSLKGNNTNASSAPTDVATSWTSYTPTISSSTGTITTATGTGRYVQIGQIVHVIIKAVITTNGTGAGTLNATLPVAAATTTPAVLHGYQSSAGNNVYGRISSSTLISMSIDAGAYPGSTGETVTISGTYESN